MKELRCGDSRAGHDIETVGAGVEYGLFSRRHLRWRNDWSAHGAIS
jgi:hypothetical protein